MRHKRLQQVIKKRIVKHFKSVPGRVELMLLYGALMFILGMSLNHITTQFMQNDGQEMNAGEWDEGEEEAPTDVAEVDQITPELPPSTSAQDMSDAQNKQPLPAVAPPGEPVKSPEPTVEARDNELTLTLKKGQSLSELLQNAGVADADVRAITESFNKQYNIRQLNIGQEVTLSFEPAPADQANTTRKNAQSQPLMLVSVVVEFTDRVIQVARQKNQQYVAFATRKMLTRKLTFASGNIKSSLSELGEELNVPFSLISAVVLAFSYEVDFQRDIQPDAKFQVLFEEYYDDAGNRVRSGQVLYAMLQVGEDEKRLYRYTPRSKGAVPEYYTAEGRTTRRQLLKTPINGAFISSGFGPRRHPISGYTKMHKGVDFAAPSGTPFFAAGDGTVVRAGRFGGYGNYIRLSHSKEFDTAYGHASRFAKGLTEGKRIHQGEVIGYVGSTGASTGPHLHFEVLRYGNQINPANLKMVPSQALSAKEMANFKMYRDKLNRIIARKPVRADLESLLR